MCSDSPAVGAGCVALLAEGVDRNNHLETCASINDVALLAEGVDRNSRCWALYQRSKVVALLAEGVDRNAA